MAYTFLKAEGYEIGKSLCDDSKIDYCKEMMAKAKEKASSCSCPWTPPASPTSPIPSMRKWRPRSSPSRPFPPTCEGCDIGPETMKLFA